MRNIYGNFEAIFFKFKIQKVSFCFAHMFSTFQIAVFRVFATILYNYFLFYWIFFIEIQVFEMKRKEMRKLKVMSFVTKKEN